jgi:hypothetical protein
LLIRFLVDREVCVEYRLGIFVLAAVSHALVPLLYWRPLGSAHLMQAPLVP